MILFLTAFWFFISSFFLGIILYEAIPNKRTPIFYIIIVSGCIIISMNIIVFVATANQLLPGQIQ